MGVDDNYIRSGTDRFGTVTHIEDTEQPKPTITKLVNFHHNDHPNKIFFSIETYDVNDGYKTIKTVPLGYVELQSLIYKESTNG